MPKVPSLEKLVPPAKVKAILKAAAKHGAAHPIKKKK